MYGYKTIYPVFHCYCGYFNFYLFFIFLSFFFLGPHPWYMEVPRLGVQTELFLPAYATAKPDPNHVCDQHHSSQQCRILNPLSEVRDWTHNFMVPSQICFHCTMRGTPGINFHRNMLPNKELWHEIKPIKLRNKSPLFMPVIPEIYYIRKLL